MEGASLIQKRAIIYLSGAGLIASREELHFAANNKEAVRRPYPNTSKWRGISFMVEMLAYDKRFNYITLM